MDTAGEDLADRTEFVGMAQIQGPRSDDQKSCEVFFNGKDLKHSECIKMCSFFGKSKKNIFPIWENAGGEQSYPGV